MQRQLHSSQAHRAQFEAADVQNVEGDLVSLSDFAQQVFNRRFGISQNQRRGARPFDSHLVFFRAALTALLPFDDERGELVAVDFREHHEDVGETPVGDEHLLAVESVMRAVFVQLRRRLCGHCI